jgi:hypothetical protein
MTVADVGLPGELVSIPRLTRELLDVVRAAIIQESGFFHDILRRCGCSSAEGVFTELKLAGFFSGHPLGLAISSRGYRTLLFASGALGAPSDDIFQELKLIEPGLYKYELVREGMTSRFIKTLLTEPGFQRLYICSPWINLQKDDFGRLAIALDKARRVLPRPPELLVLVQTPRTPEAVQTLNKLRWLGAVIIEKPKLHSKLYMREPGPSGGLWLGIVGSENLTKQKWIELGIEIRNDSHLLSKLRNYFFELFGRATGE